MVHACSWLALNFIFLQGKHSFFVILAQGNKRAMNRLTEMKRSGNRKINQARPTRQDAKDECVIM